MTAEPDLLPSSIAAFTEALHGDRGSLDAWLEANDEHEVAAHVEAYARANVAHAIAPLQAEIEALRVKVADARDGWHMANGVAELAMKHRHAAEARAERLAEALREAEKDLRQLSVIDCGCKPCRRACRTGKGAEWELESRLETAHAAANKARAALNAIQENDDA